jgi:DNA polymerase III sliding clamp (beta) subunit (PCNA family)
VKAILRTIAGALTVRFAFGDRMARIEAGERILLTTLIGGRFPDYRKLIPDNLTGSLAVSSRRILEIVGMAQALGGDDAKILRVEPLVDLVTCVASNEAAMSAELPGRREGETPELFGLNASHLGAFAERWDGEMTLRFAEDPRRPILVESGDLTMSGIIMPVSLG